MARLLRLEFAGALYHLTSRGDRREAIYRTDEDREAWLEVLGNAVTVFKGGDDPGRISPVRMPWPRSAIILAYTI